MGTMIVCFENNDDNFIFSLWIRVSASIIEIGLSPKAGLSLYNVNWQFRSEYEKPGLIWWLLQLKPFAFFNQKIKKERETCWA